MRLTITSSSSFISIALAIAALVSCPSLAAEEQSRTRAQKPLAVYVFDPSCISWNEKALKAFNELKEEYGDRVTFAELNEAPSHSSENAKTARELGVSSYLNAVKDLSPLIMIFSSDRRRCKEIVGPKEKDTYKLALDKILAGEPTPASDGQKSESPTHPEPKKSNADQVDTSK